MPETVVAEQPETQEGQKPLTAQDSYACWKQLNESKAKLIERQKEDFLFRFGEQWDKEKQRKLKELGVEAVVDNRVQANIFLLTGLERQNRAEFKAYPDGREDGAKAEIATTLFKDSIKKSDFLYKASESFEDGITCGEGYLELYVDNTKDILNGKPCWKKLNYCEIFVDDASVEYDLSDADYIYKLTRDLPEEKLIAMFPKHAVAIKALPAAKAAVKALGAEGTHVQPKDYAKGNEGSGSYGAQRRPYDLLERYYKKWVLKAYIGDQQTGELMEAETPAKADEFLKGYKEDAMAEFEQYSRAVQLAQGNPQATAAMQAMPKPRDAERYIVIPRNVPEIWYFAHIGTADLVLADERAWSYPKCSRYPIVPYFAHYSTTPLQGDEAHLLKQGIVHGIKGLQRKHNSAETLKLMHLNASANSGWLEEEDTWVDPSAANKFGSSPGVHLIFKKTVVNKPERIQSVQLSDAHTKMAEEAAEAIKAVLGMNADLLAMQQGGTDSGRAISLRMKQGLLMVQKLFDNNSRTKIICGKLMLSQLSEFYDTEKTKKILGDAWLIENFPPLMLVDPAGGVDETGNPKMVPAPDPKTGQPMQYDSAKADITIAEVLAGDLEEYDVTVGESVASDTMQLAKMLELQEIAEKFPGLIPPQILIEESQLGEASKRRILAMIQQAQLMAQQSQAVRK